jgi:mono/diheme cytochrome c family protein
MRVKNIVAVALTVAMLLLSIETPAADFQDYSGKQLYMRFCASCHGETGAGDGPVSGSFTVMVPDLAMLTRRQGGKFPFDRLHEIIDGRTVVVVHGTRYMPVWGYEFWVEQGADSEAEIETAEMVNRLVNYLHSIQQ